MKLFHILPGVLLALSASRVYAGNVRYPYAINGKRSTTPRYAKRDECVQCIKPANSEIVAPLENIWKGLTDEEVQSVAQFLVTYSEFNITLSNPSANSTAPLSPNGTDSTQPAPPSQNSTSGLLGTDTLLLIELLLPNKTEALLYTDGKGPAPARYAHAVIHVGTVKVPYVQDIRVGPLPVAVGTTRIEPLNYPYNKGVGRTRNSLVKIFENADWLNQVGANLSDITMDLWGKSMTGLANDTLSLVDNTSPVEEDGRLVSWVQFHTVPTFDFDSSTLLPLGLYIKTDLTGRDASEWKVAGILYNDIFYDTIDEFRTAITTEGFIRNGANEDGSWAHTDQEGPIMKGDELYPPIPIAPQGSRFSIDPMKQYVEWMDFSFYIAFSRDTGVRLFNIKYKRDRIIYEIGLQEAMAIYAGNDPIQSGTAFFDILGGMGTTSFTLVPGFDCPAYATFLNSTTHDSGTPTLNLGSICIFEQDAAYPIFRHTASNYIASTKNNFLTLRSISTMGNYDYLLDYSFYTDGSIQVEARASGYIRSAYFAKNGEYGYKIHDNLSGSMHDHVINYKVDFDILGTKNTVATSEFIPTTETYSWSGGRKIKTFKLEKSWITNEKDGKIDWDPNAAKSYAVVNKEEKNKYGEYRGYKIQPLTPGVRATVQESTNLGIAAQWAHHNLYVTKRKDTEPASSHPYASLDVWDPAIRFDKFFDDESLEQEDLVMWFNIGMHHAPSTGDLPSTTFTSAHGGVRIEPMNYFLSNPAKQTKQMVHVNMSTLNVTTFGAVPMNCSVKVPDVTEGWGRLGF